MLRSLLVGSIAVASVAAGLGGVTGAETSARPERLAARTPQLAQLLGFVDARLVRVDPETLRPLRGKGIAVGSGGCVSRSGGTACWSYPPWTVSPDGERVLLARNDLTSVHIVDVRQMRVSEKVRFTTGSLGSLAWLAGGRMLALEETCCKERQRLVVFDITIGRVIARRTLGGSVEQLARTADELVMLLAPAQAIGPARLAVADPQGGVRFVRLRRILAGSKLLGTGSDHRVDARHPGFAVDPEARRAFVVGKSLAAEVDLGSLAVSYHSLDRPTSFLSRFWNWLEPAAQAKQVSGYERSARWLGGDLVVVSGLDTAESESRAAGLSVIDTRDWKVRMLDREATTFEVAESLLLATGGRWDPSRKRSVGIGLASYDVDGEKHFQLFDGEQSWVALAYGGRAYVNISGQETLRIVDLAAGRVVGTRQQPLPELLLGTASGWWGDS